MEILIKSGADVNSAEVVSFMSKLLIILNHIKLHYYLESADSLAHCFTKWSYLIIETLTKAGSDLKAVDKVICYTCVIYSSKLVNCGPLYGHNAYGAAVWPNVSAQTVIK